MNNLLAQSEGGTINLNPTTGTPFTGLTEATIGSLISGLITLVLIVAAVVFFFMLIIGGLRWILSGGDKANTEAARSQITAALVGLVIVFAAFAIVNVIEALFGFSILELQLPNLVGTTVG